MCEGISFKSFINISFHLKETSLMYQYFGIHIYDGNQYCARQPKFSQTAKWKLTKQIIAQFCYMKEHPSKVR